MDFNPLQNEIQLLMLLYGLTVVAALLVVRRCFSLESKSFLFQFFIASVLFAVGCVRLNGFHWVISLPFVLLVLSISCNKNGKEGNKKNNIIRKGKEFL